MTKQILSGTAEYKIEIISTSSVINKDFENWLRNKALSLGTGKQIEYYYDEENDIDIKIIFTTSITIN
jgi:hypothetical protein